MLTQARLTFRLNRFMLLSVAAMLILASLAALFVAVRLRAVGATSQCFALWQGLPTDGSAPTTCQSQVSQFYEIDNSQAAPLMGVLMWLTPIAGLLAGVSLVAREIEERTAAVAWSLATSRTRWLFGRVAPVAGLLAVLFAAAAISGTELQRARQPMIDPLLSFDTDAGRGLTLVATGLLFFSVAVLVGSVMGRVLPALLVAAVAGLILLGGSMAVRAAWLPSQSVVVDQTTGYTRYDGALYLEYLVRLPSGELTSDQGLMVGIDTSGNMIGQVDGATSAIRLVLGSRHPFVEAVQSAGTIAVAGGLLAATAFVVRRRRPS
jgi:ABC-type transport system involved in multi-copper enzyme maturation permease subunit